MRYTGVLRLPAPQHWNYGILALGSGRGHTTFPYAVLPNRKASCTGMAILSQLRHPFLRCAIT
jgi:hypothetical protein